MKPKQLMLLIAATMLLQTQTTSGQDKRVGGPCEGCEAIHESPVPFDKLDLLVKLPGATWEGQKPMGINGIVYRADGTTPAPGVVLYIYHTDQTGRYTAKDNATGWGRRHGHLRGWMRTNEKGEYKFVTMRPAPYPGRTDPAHIHITIKEPGLNEYYIDEYVFADDPLLTADQRRKLENRGGSGILTLKDVGNMYKAERHIYLGKNIPNYPASQ